MVLQPRREVRHSGTDRTEIRRRLDSRPLEVRQLDDYTVRPGNLRRDTVCRTVDTSDDLTRLGGGLVSRLLRGTTFIVTEDQRGELHLSHQSLSLSFGSKSSEASAFKAD